MKQPLRIIAGTHRGRNIPVLDLPGLRPTPNRVRETLFNWLQGQLSGMRCLDAFAGSGSLGFEARSRGASEVIMLEHSSKAYQHLKQTAKALFSSGVQVQQADALRFMEREQKGFDLIFLDPPFDKQLWRPCIESIARNALLQKGGLLYVESPEEMSLTDGLWTCLKCKKAGQVVYALYAFRAGS